METIIGIDLGTTNSEVAVIQQGRPHVIAGENNSRIMPSFVSFTEEGHILVGEPAKNQYALYPERTIKSIKRKMGSDERLTMGTNVYTPQEISAIILRALKERAEKFLGYKVEKAVITVPAYFSDAQRQATRDAGEIAGLEVMRILNEPTAASLAYETDHHKEEKIVVYDLGGGTFDVSVVNIHAGLVEVLASHGNNHLGGDDFDEKLYEFILDHLKTELHEEHLERLKKDTRFHARLLRAAEQAKRELTDKPFAVIEEEYLAEKKGTPYHLSLEISRHAYEEMINPYIEETLKAIQIALEGAQLKPTQIDQLLLVGGATRTPMISRIIQKRLKITPRLELEPDLCVAMGAAIQAGIIAGEKVSAVLVDVTPYTFGTSYLGELHGLPYNNVFAPIIKKNTPIPVSKSEVFYTVRDYQKAVDVDVYQGDDPDAHNNIPIGAFKIEGLSHVPVHNEIICTFDLDLDGILRVSATEKRTGLNKHITIENAISQFQTEEEKEKAKNKINTLFSSEKQTADAPDDGLLTKELREKIVQGKALAEKAEKMLPTIPEEDKEEVIDCIEAIRDTISHADFKQLSFHIEELSEILFYLES
ncbi:MAG: Hsp70 family protein [bacterium]